MNHVLPSALVILLGLLGLRVAAARVERTARTFMIAAFAAHVASAFAQVIITESVYGGGDMLNYVMWGTDVVRAVESGSTTAMRETLNLLLQQPSAFDYLPTPQSTTGSMIAIVGTLLVALGQSMYAVCLALSLTAFFGSVALYVAVRRSLKTASPGTIEVATLLTPSVVFWSSGILKETVAMAAFGPMLLGTSLFLSGRWLRGAVLTVAGGFVIGLLKPYILFTYGIAVVAWAYAHRASRVSRGRPITIKPVYVALGVLVAVGGVAMLGSLFPKYGTEKLVENMSHYQDLGEQVGGGSYYSLGAGGGEGGASRQVLFAPLALLTALFRPLIFEARNPQMFVSALEATALLVLFARAARAPRASWRHVRTEPFLMFATAFTLTFSTAVGLASTNLGTLVRYRVPMIPFWALLLLSLRHPSHAHQQENVRALVRP